MKNREMCLAYERHLSICCYLIAASILLNMVLFILCVLLFVKGNFYNL